MYDRRVGDRVLTFGHEGLLYRNSFVMYERETRSLWIHTTGEAVKGLLQGTRLTFLPSVVTTWKRWRQAYPNTTVLDGRRASGFMGSFPLKHAPDEYGLSVGQGDRPKLYPYRLLSKRKVVNDSLGGKPIVVFFDSDSFSATSFERGERTFEWRDGIFRDETGIEWNPLTGESPTGSLARVPSTVWLTDRRHAFYPDGDVYR